MGSNSKRRLVLQARLPQTTDHYGPRTKMAKAAAIGKSVTTSLRPHKYFRPIRAVTDERGEDNPREFAGDARDLVN